MHSTRPMTMHDRLTLMLAGAAGAGLWAAQTPLDQRVLGAGYDDIELLGRLVRPEGDGWQAAGWAIHLANGAVFGLAFSELLRRLPDDVSPRGAAHAMAMAEHLGLYPLAWLLDRVHPARGRIARSFGRREFVQATWRHALLGLVLGAAARRVARRRALSRA